MKILLKVLQLNPNDVITLNNIGMVYRFLQKYNEALDYYNKVLQLYPNDINTLNNKANIFRFKGQFEDALDCCNSVLKLNLTDIAALYSKGMIYKALGKYNDALDYYNQVLQLNPNNVDVLNNKGMVYNSLGKYNEALDYCNQSLQLNPNNVNTLQNKGDILAQKGNLKEALESYENASKLDPNNFFLKEKIIILTNSNSANIIQQPFDVMIQQLSINDQNLIYQELFGKLLRDAAVFWIVKLTPFYQEYNQEICLYCKQILPYLITSNEFQQLSIQRFNVNCGGIYKNEEVAIKEIQFYKNKIDGNSIIHLLREIAILAYYKHPNIEEIKAVYFNPTKVNDKYQVQIIQKRYFMDLNSVLFITKQQINKKVICYQILKALRYIHEAGLVHLCINPNNVMFRDESLTDIVIIDFGVSEIYRENQGVQLLGMTPAYSSPETRFHDLSMVSPKSDIFSFGILFYELITEKRAWSKYQNQSQIYNIIRNPNFEFFSENIPTGINKIDQLIQNCLSIDPRQRPSARESQEIIKKFEFEF